MNKRKHIVVLEAGNNWLFLHGSVNDPKAKDGKAWLWAQWPRQAMEFESLEAAEAIIMFISEGNTFSYFARRAY